MAENKQTENQIVLKRNTFFLGIGVVAVFMAAMVIRIIFAILPFGDEYDAFALIFLSVWTAAVLAMAVYAFTVCSRKIVIDNKGISCKTWFSNTLIKWDEIKDWGLSYCGNNRGVVNIYYLYFAKDQRPIKNEFTKKLKGKMIKSFVFGNGYDEVISDVIPFCKARTQVEPFIAKDKPHFM